MTYALLALAIAVAALGAFIRLAPSDPTRWHVDPLTAEDPGAGGILHLPGPGAVTYPVSPEDLMTTIDRLAMAEPRVSRLAGSAGALHATYVARSRLLGFPDYISIRAVPVPGGAQLAVLSRLRFGRGDMGVNRARLDDWLARMESLLPA